METTVKDRLITYLKKKGIGRNKFEKAAGLSFGYITNLKKSPGTDVLVKILTAAPDLNKDWLLTGEGEMLVSNTQQEPKKEDSEKTENDLVLVIPSRAMGGTLADFANSVHEYDCEKAVSPIKGADYIITVTGYSMEPEYPNGSKVVIKKINERAFIDWGRTYVLDTCNGAVIKRIMPGSTPECVRCVSVNPDYPDFEVLFSDMFGMYRVMMLMCEK